MTMMLYIDPTSAGLGIQMLLGGVVGGLVGIRLFWDRLFSLVRRSKRKEEALAIGEEERTPTGEQI